MPLSRALYLGLFFLWAGPAAAHPGHKAPEGHFHVFAAPAPGRPETVEMGACVGDKAPAKSAAELAKPPVYEHKTAADKITDEELKIWEQLGYKLDKKTGQLSRPQGQLETAAMVTWLGDPFNAASEKLPAFVWMGVHGQGYRLEEATCRLVNAKKEAVTRLELKVYEWWVGRSSELMAVQSLHAALAKLDPSKPVPPDITQRVRQLQSAQMQLPDGLEKQLLEAKNVKDALAAVDKAHEASLRFWDGMMPLNELQKAAQPAVLGYGQAGQKTYFDAAEARLSHALRQDVLKLFAGNGPGSELMSRFKDKKGVVQLPRITIWKVSQRPDDPGYGRSAAFYDSSQDAIVVNYWAITQGVINAAPETERKRLSKELADPKKLTAYLEANPAARQAFVEATDLTLYHELTHAWQARRSKASVEQTRGNLPAANPVEEEHEAFRDEYRYFHAKIMANPQKYLNDPHMSSYLGMLSNYDEFRDGITRMYLSNFGGTSDFPTIKTMQDNRRGIFDRFPGWAPGSWLRNALRKQGMKLGDQALAQAETDSKKRTKEFEVEWGKMRKEAGPRLIAVYEKAGEPHKALLAGVGLGGALPASELDRLERATLKQIAGLKDDSFQKVQRWEVLEKAYDLRGKDMDPKLDKTRRADYSAVVRGYLNMLHDNPAHPEKAGIVEWAKTYALKSDDKDKLLEEIRKAEATKR